MTDTKLVAVALIKDSGGKYLFIKPSDYKDFGEHQDAWYPPTGHVKENESIEQCLVRELKEELNLDIKPIRLVSEWEQDVPGEKAFWWECQIIGGEITKSHEIKEYKHFSPEEIKNLKLWPATKKFFENFIWNGK
jgi:8-oxo-dGTP diphosphatase